MYLQRPSHSMQFVVIVLCAILVLPGGVPLSESVLSASTQDSQAAGVVAVDFNREVKPLLSSRCFLCHGPDESSREADLRLDTFEGATESGAIEPGDVEASELLRRITSNDESEVMPPPEHGQSLSEAEVDVLKRWIAAGAKYETHWAYAPPVTPRVPDFENESALAEIAGGFVNNEVDAFVLQQMQAHGLSPSPRADRLTLARRLSLDLTGLPPSIEMADAFANDDSPDAYERLVDRLLASPAYGEHWAASWLDLARYADSAGYAEDKPRAIWAYRDYVIRSFENNQPFDQFTIEQIAGDLLENATDETRIATAFHRNTLTNSEGGTDDEEFRTAAVVDRTNTTMAVWMGTTMACAQCHTHKYDPITQAEYFQLYAMLNNTADNDRPNEAPVLAIYTEEQLAARQSLEQQIAELERQSKEASQEAPAQTQDRLDRELRAWVAAMAVPPAQGSPPAEVADIHVEIAPLIQIQEDQRTEDQQSKLREFFAASFSSDAQRQLKLATLKTSLTQIKPETTVPVMAELPADQQRTTRIQIRGSHANLGDEVEPGTPSALHPISEEIKRAAAGQDRLALAHWLIDRQNPLTARVVVNRYWQKLFGKGLVVTSEDFGAQGEMPTHADLLDYLAVKYMDSGWDNRALLKFLVMSATYQQSARATAEQLKLDADNRWLARGPRFRVSAEVVRDQALFVSGLLSQKKYGPPVHPPAPELGLRAAFSGAIQWKASTDEDRYRRAIYTEWRRSSPYPSMETFDVSNREVCDLRRVATNTPLQALVTLNDEVYVEAAQALARKMMALDSDPLDSDPLDSDSRKLARWGFRTVLIRQPTSAELDELVRLFERTKTHFSQTEELRAEAKLLAEDPLHPVDPNTDFVELAAWTTVANVLLNLDEVFLKP